MSECDRCAYNLGDYTCGNSNHVMPASRTLVYCPRKNDKESTLSFLQLMEKRGDV